VFLLFLINTTLGAKPQTVLAHGKAKQQHVGLIRKWNYCAGQPTMQCPVTPAAKTEVDIAQSDNLAATVMGEA